ncbi:hypothetical protein B0H13DRAFT_2653444 [Mycena leptocephala]|nr:hypothetical protein B0H13DRAFT_2653444 [Mycena leptocephala]
MTSVPEPIPAPLPSSNPQLPQYVWKKFKKEYPESIIFSSFNVPRHLLSTGEILADSSEYITHFVPNTVGREEFLNLNPGWLHLAVFLSDLPLACEALRLGSPIQHKERRGFSAVYFGCAWVERESTLHSPRIPILHSSPPSSSLSLWLGSPLSACHAKDQPYPGEYLCPCCSRKTYAKCCQKKIAFTWSERWTDETQFHWVKTVIQPMQFTDPEEQTEFIAKMQSMNKAEQRDLLPTPEGTRKSFSIPEPSSKLLRCTAKSIVRLQKQPRRQVIFRSVPGWIDVTSKVDGKALMGHWNQAIDDCIASGVDHRGWRIIENAAKIGIAGGPLFRKCEANGCANIEGRDSVRLLVCAGCKTAVYCSKSCRRARGIPQACVSFRDRTVQALPSQIAILKEMAQLTGMDLSYDKKALNAACESFGSKQGFKLGLEQRCQQRPSVSKYTVY